MRFPSIAASGRWPHWRRRRRISCRTWPPAPRGVNIAGGSVWDNAYFVDGVDVTDPLNGSSGTNLPYNFLQAVEVKTGGYEAEYGRALGGVVNMVTPTGGNRFEGQIFSFLSDHRLRTAATTEQRAQPRHLYPVRLGSRSPARSGRTGPGSTDYIHRGRPDRFVSGHGPRPRPPATVPVRRKVTWQPQPVTRLSVTFTGDPSWHDAVTPGDSRLQTRYSIRTSSWAGSWMVAAASHSAAATSSLEVAARGEPSRSLFRRTGS